MAEHVSAKQNLVGPVVRKLRDQQGMTQEMLAARCTVMGFEVSRGTLAKIEAELRCVTDKELVILAKALKVGIAELFQDGKR